MATGEFSYAGSGVLHYADLSAFSITVAGVPYDLAFADASTNYSYFAYDTTSNSFVAGQGTGDYGQLDSVTLTPKAVPEPPTLVLFGVSLIGLGFLRRRKVAVQSPVKAYV